MFDAKPGLFILKTIDVRKLVKNKYYNQRTSIISSLYVCMAIKQRERL